ncbi:MAG: (Fe-S)-binding protein [Gammaproteobacteria bacterium]|nr:(Fe-S)-binding protein [Gammaproteobacteria bacterium]
MNQEEMIVEAGRCVKCGLCLPHCPTYGLTLDEGDSPRGRIALIQALASSELPSERGHFHLDRCLGCRACEAACPSGVRYGELIGNAWCLPHKRPHTTILRALKQLTKMVYQPWSGSLLKIYQRTPLQTIGRHSGSTTVKALDQLLPANTEKIKLKSHYPATGTASGKIGLFTGCISRITEAALIHGAIKLLNQLDIDVIIPEDQRCCGALHQHSGDEEGTLTLAKRNQQAFNNQPLDALITLASGCAAHLIEYPSLGTPFSPPVADISHYLLHQINPDQFKLNPLSKRVYLHNPCTLRNVLKQSDTVETLLRLIPGIDLKLMPQEGCCGGAGSYLLTQPEMSEQLRQHNLSTITPESGDILVTSNTGCALQFSRGFRKDGLDIEVLHPIELITRQL